MQNDQVSAREALWCAAAALALLLLLLSSCNYNEPETYLDTATVRVNDAPAAYARPRYGSVVAGFTHLVGGQMVSRFAASAGAGSPIVISRAWDGRTIGERPIQRCKDRECPEGSDVGATLIPFAVWGAGETVPRSGCVFAPSNPREGAAAGGLGFVVCESDSVPQHFDLRLEAVRGDAQLQFSGFGLPPGHPLGVVLFGAHALERRTGARARGGLYAQPDLTRVGAEPVAKAPVSVRLRDPGSGRALSDEAEAGDLGRQVVGAVDAAGTLWVAVSQPSRARVLVATYHDELPGAPDEKLVLRACVDAPVPGLRGFGERLALGDVDGDGRPDLFAGSDPHAGSEPGRQALFMFAGSGLPSRDRAAARCPRWNGEAVPVPCQDQGGIACADADFGASLAVGDIDGDGRGDLMVGAPRATVDRVAEAGAVFLVPGGDAGLDGTRRQVIAAAPRTRAQFGAALAALRTRDRDEPVIGAPGSGRVYVFLCTPLEQGFGPESQCLPR